MDPSFIFSIANLAQQNNLANNSGLAAQYELQAHLKAEKVLSERIDIRNQVNKISNSLLRLMPNHPKQVYVLITCYSQELEGNGVIPDNFEEIGEKEKTVLVWKKMRNLFEKCESYMTSDFHSECEKCIEAINKIRFVQYCAPRVDDYEKYEKQLPKTQRIKKINNVCKALLWIFPLISIGLTTLSVFFSKQIVWKITWSSLPDLILMLGFFGEILLVGIYAIIRGIFLDEAIKVLEHYTKASNATDNEFWNYVKSQFNSVPNLAQLQSLYDSNIILINEFYKDFPDIEQEVDQ